MIPCIECFHMTSWRPYWCPKTTKRRPCWCPKPVLWELNSFLMQTLSFVPINLNRCWPCEWKHSIGVSALRAIRVTIKQIMGKQDHQGDRENGKCRFVPCAQELLYLSLTVHYVHKKDNSFTLVLCKFYLLISYFEKLSNWIWRLRWTWGE